VIVDLETNEMYVILWISPMGEYGYWYNLSSNSRIPSRFSTADITSGITSSKYETTTLSVQVRTESTLNDNERSTRDSRWNKIQSIVTSEPDVYERNMRLKLMQSSAVKNEVTIEQLYRLIDRYWRNGKSKNALLPMYSNCGAKGQTRKQKDTKLGAKPQNDVSIGKVLNDTDYSNFSRAVRKYYFTQQKRSLKSTYEKLLQDFYVSKICDGRLKLLEPTALPSFRQFQYWYYKNRDIVAETKNRDGERSFELNSRAITGKSDYGLMGPGAQFQIDATVGDVYLVSQFDPSAIVGRPIIYFILDAFSRMVVGMGVGLEGPSWNALADSIINMATDKVAYCAKYGVEITEDEWPNRHVPASLLGDRGELESKNADNLASIFGIRVINAPPYRADLKGIIEQHFRTININSIKQLPGSVKPEMSKRGGHDYRLDATLDINQVTKILIKCVLYYNNYHYLESIEKNGDMIASGVHTVPIKLWEWGIKNYSGALRSYPEDVVKFAVLPIEKATVTAKGIRFKGLFYICDRAKAENWFEKARSSKTWSITVAYDSRDMENIYIWSPDVKRYEICYLLDWNSKNAGKTLMEVTYEQRRERLEGQRLKITETEAKVNLNADIEAIINEAESISKSASAKTKSERVSQIRENRANEREAMRNGDMPQIIANRSLPPKPAEVEVSPTFSKIKAKLEERLKNDGTKSDL
jgi:hypothetical protein